MYNAIIDKGATFLLLDNGSPNVYDGDMSGFLINNSNIINLMNALPIRQYYAWTKEEPIKISKEQAKHLYQQLIDCNLKAKKFNKSL